MNKVNYKLNYFSLNLPVSEGIKLGIKNKQSNNTESKYFTKAKF